MKTCEITVMAAAVALDALERMYQKALEAQNAGTATPAQKMLVVAYREIEDSLENAR